MSAELRVDTRKAGTWSLLAGTALLLHALLGELAAAARPLTLLAVLGFGLILPALAILHVRIGARLPQAGVLATLSGLATALVGVAAVWVLPLQPAALFFLGLWWWTIGKFVAFSAALLARPFGAVTATLGLIALGLAALSALGTGAWTGDFGRLLLGAWLLALGALFWREAGPDEG